MPYKPRKVSAIGKLPPAIETGARNRESAHARGYTAAWRKAREAYLSAHPWCAVCLAKGRREPASEVDHIRPHKGDKRLFWDKANWQPLCKPCHSAKTATEDGAFGNPKKPPPPR